MRKIEYSSGFKKDYKRELKGKYQKSLDRRLEKLLSFLVENKVLEISHRDHELLGDWSGYRECDIWPDLLLIYRKIGIDLLRLARLGSHSELFNK